MGKRMTGSLWVLGGFVLAVVLPFLGTWLRRTPEARCALDGGALEPDYRVRIEDASGRAYDFCCIRCAETWLTRQTEPPRAIYVTDEISRQPIEAGSAFFVRSLAVTTPTTGNRIHAFRARADAERHARDSHGTILFDGERPFADAR